MLRPREVPVAVSGTFLVMAELAMVLRRAPDITIGIIITHSRGIVVAKLCIHNGRRIGSDYVRVCVGGGGGGGERECKIVPN